MQGSFIYNNKEILLIPGESFSKNQLKSRLHEMEVDFNNNEKKKQYYVEKYNQNIYNEYYRSKIIDKLIIDTNNSKRKSISKKDIRDSNSEINQKHFINQIDKINDSFPKSKIDELMNKRLKLYNDSIQNSNIELNHQIDSNKSKTSFVETMFSQNNFNNITNPKFLHNNNNFYLNNIQNNSTLIDSDIFQSDNISPLKNNQSHNIFVQPNNIENNNNFFYLNNNQNNIFVQPNKFQNNNILVGQKNNSLVESINNQNNNILLNQNNSQNHSIFVEPNNIQNNNILVNPNNNNFSNLNTNQYHNIFDNPNIFQNNNFFVNQNNNSLAELNDNTKNTSHFNLNNIQNNNIIFDLNNNETNNILYVTNKKNNQEKKDINKNNEIPLNNNSNPNKIYKDMNTIIFQNQSFSIYKNDVKKNTISNSNYQHFKEEDNIYFTILPNSNIKRNLDSKINNIGINQSNNLYSMEKNNHYYQSNHNINRNQSTNFSKKKINIIHNNIESNNMYSKNSNKNFYNNPFIFGKQFIKYENTLDNSFKNLYDSSPLNFRNSISLIDSQNYVTNNNSLNTFFSKERMDILYSVLASLLIFGTFICIYKKLIIKINSFSNNFYSMFDCLNPKKIIYDFFITNLLIVLRKFSWDYLNITFPVILLTIIISYLLKQYKINKNLKIIFNDIIHKLINLSLNQKEVSNGINGISEYDIIKEYSMRLNISSVYFSKYYMTKLREMRKKNQNLKLHEEFINGRKVVYWEYKN